MSDLATIADLCTAGGTLVLAVATYAAVRSGNRSARLAEESMLNAARPILVASRMGEAAEKVGFVDGHWTRVESGRSHVEVTDEAIYMAMSLRNVGSGLAVLHGWCITPRQVTGDVARPDVETFRRLTRDLFVSPGDNGFWQGALRDPTAPEFADVRKAVENGEILTIDLLYGDHEGGQRAIGRFTLTPHEDTAPFVSIGRHWNVDRSDLR